MPDTCVPELRPERLASVFDHMPEAAVVAAHDRRIVYVNPAAVALFGFAPAELIGQRTSVLYASTSDFARQGATRYRPEAPRGSQPYRVEYRRRDGTSFMGTTCPSTIVDAEGQTVGFVGLVRVATRMERTIHAMQELHRIAANTGAGAERRIDAILRLGTEHFGLPLGILSAVEGDVYTVEHVIDPSGAVQPGATFDLASTYCCHTLVAQAPVGFHLVRESTIRNHPCYRNFRLEAYLGAPVYVGGDVVGTLNFSSSASCEPFTADDMALVTLFAQWIGHVVAEERARANLERLATVDSLTGVLNRGAVMERLGWQVAHARRTGQPLSVVMLDIDRFKSINDSWGHDAGERVLRGLGKLCLGVSREIDICGRLGGEEFLLVLPATDLAGAKRMCQRLVRALRWQEVELPTGEVLTVTASVGVAALAGPEEDAEGLLARADGAMYAAKAGGRDQVRLAS